MVLCPRQQEAFNNRSKKGLSDTGFRRPGHALFTCWLVFLLFYVKVLLIEGGVEFIKQKNTFRYRKKETQHPISIFFFSYENNTGSLRACPNMGCLLLYIGTVPRARGSSFDWVCMLSTSKNSLARCSSCYICNKYHLQRSSVFTKGERWNALNKLSSSVCLK